IAALSVEQCQQRYVEMKERHRRQRERGRCFEAEFITADCTKERLKDVYKDSDIQFNIVSCQFAFHYCFESITQARIMLRNISECLKPGGFFIGTVPDAYDIMRRLEEASDCSFGNDVFSVTFPSKEQPSLFGAKYDFHLEGVVDCPEFLVYFPALLKLAEEVDLELLYCKRFEDYYEDKCKNQEGQFLLTKMQALETYPPLLKNQKSVGSNDDYHSAQQKIKDLKEQQEEEPIHVGLHTMTATSISKLTSDHNPVNFDINLNNFTSPPLSIFAFPNWQKFQTILSESIPRNPTISNKNDIDLAVTNFNNRIQDALHATSTYKAIHHPITIIPHQLREKVKHKNRFRKEWQQTKYPLLKTQINKLQREIRSAINNYKNSTWNKILEQASPKDNSLYSLIKSKENKLSQIPQIRCPQGLAYDAKTKASIFVRSLEDSFSNTDPFDADFIEKVDSRTNRFLANEVDTIPPSHLLEK
ncbi:mRNA cap guanine-N7 methyltransferase, partial [Trichonephila inaurata madagascariensis]